MEKNKSKVAFVIAHKYVKGYESFIEYYISNINSFYESPLIMIVDNNSVYKKEIFQKIEKIKNVILLENNIDCKFEIGAYKVGLKYIIDNNILNKYDYFVFVQDNFVIKNVFDFNKLKTDQIYACAINSAPFDNGISYIIHRDLSKIGLYNNLEKTRLVWCSSFVVASNKILQLNNFLNPIILSTREESKGGERYLGRILWELNDKKNADIDGDIFLLESKYNCWSVDLYSEINTAFFVKKLQQKTETTQDI